MVRTAAKVLLRIIPVLIVVSIATALLIQLLPGDPAVAIAGPDASPAQYAAIRESLGLNEPLFSRYLSWLGGFVQGDLGQDSCPAGPGRGLVDRRPSTGDAGAGDSRVACCRW